MLMRGMLLLLTQVSLGMGIPGMVDMVDPCARTMIAVACGELIGTLVASKRRVWIVSAAKKAKNNEVCLPAQFMVNKRIS